MKILVTGASGLLGSNVVTQALRRNHSVIGMVNSFDMPARERLELVSMDLQDSKSLDRRLLDHWPDVIVNTAAISQPDAVHSQPELAANVNVAMPMRLAQLAHHIGALLIHISTDMVFSGKDEGSYQTTDLPEPASIYGKQKLQSEREVLEHCTDRPIVLRIPILMGNGIQQNRSVHEKLLLTIAEGKRPSLFTNEMRQPASATNVAELIVELAERGNLTGIFHWAGANVVSRADLGTAILDKFGLDTELIDHVECTDPDRPLNLELSSRPLLGKMRTQPWSLESQLSELSVPDSIYPWYESQF
ncbi:MAG: SDR family oxidoreductase [Verrucomicrobiota bacterium]